MMLLSAPLRAADTVKLAENGKALATIEIAPEASVATRSVAKEMASYLERISGAPFEVTNTPGAGARIVLGRNNEFPAYKYGDKLRGNGQEAFLMRTEGDRVLLLGVTDRAASHAAYAFLEKLGVRWFFPTKEWEIVPSKEYSDGQLRRSAKPRHAAPPRHLVRQHEHAATPANHLRIDWMRHNRMKTDGPSTSHSWIGLDPKKDFEEHPEWFALVKGKRQPTQAQLRPSRSHQKGH